MINNLIVKTKIKFPIRINLEYLGAFLLIVFCNFWVYKAKPVIASNIGGIPEQVEHNKTGLLFEPGNVEQLKECILKYWNNPQLVIEHGKNGYQKAITQYTEDRYYKELQGVI